MSLNFASSVLHRLSSQHRFGTTEVQALFPRRSSSPLSRRKFGFLVSITMLSTNPFSLSMRAILKFKVSTDCERECVTLKAHQHFCLDNTRQQHDS